LRDITVTDKHSHGNALLEAAVLAKMPLPLAPFTVLSIMTLVDQLLLHGAHKKGSTALTADGSVVTT